MLYVALLRGINVGGNAQVSMAELAACFRVLGFTRVKTYINSGNVIFESDQESDVLGGQIEEALEAKFGFKISCVIRTIEGLRELNAALPANWKNDTEMKSDVMFLWPEFDSESVLEQLTIVEGVDTVRYLPGAIAWSVSRENQPKSGMHKLLGTKVYKNMTVRNINTVRKLAETPDLYRVGGLLVRDKKLLLVTGYQEKEFWTPGGRVEANETIEACLKRELQEELGITAFTCVDTNEYAWHRRSRPDEIRHYAVALIKTDEEPHPNAEITTLRWFSHDELKKENGVSADVLKNALPYLTKQGLL